MMPSSTRRLASLAALVFVCAAAPALASNPVAAAEPPPAADVEGVDLLAALNAVTGSTALTARRLGTDLDRATARLASRRLADLPALEAKSARSAGVTLGIGAIGRKRTATVYPAVYAGTDALPVRDARTSPAAAAAFARLTDRAAECYGQPLIGHNADSDQLTVAVAIDAQGRVLAAGVVKDPQWGARDLDACLAPALAAARFPAGLGAVELRYTWTFDFAATDFVF